MSEVPLYASRCRAKRERFKKMTSPECQDQNLVMTVFHLPNSLVRDGRHAPPKSRCVRNTRGCLAVARTASCDVAAFSRTAVCVWDGAAGLLGPSSQPPPHTHGGKKLTGTTPEAIDPQRGYIRCRARREQLKRFYELAPVNGSSQGQNLALTVLIVPNSLDNGNRTPDVVFKQKG